MFPLIWNRSFWEQNPDWIVLVVSKVDISKIANPNSNFSQLHRFVIFLRYLDMDCFSLLLTLCPCYQSEFPSAVVYGL